MLDNRAFREYYIYTLVSSNKNLNSHYIKVLSCVSLIFSVLWSGLNVNCLNEEFVNCFNLRG